MFCSIIEITRLPPIGVTRKGVEGPWEESGKGPRDKGIHRAAHTRDREEGVLDLMVVQIGFSVWPGKSYLVWAGTATPPPVGCPPELYERMGNFSFV